VYCVCFFIEYVTVICTVQNNQFSFGQKYLLIIIQLLKKLKYIYILHIFLMSIYFMEYSIDSRQLLHGAYIEQGIQLKYTCLKTGLYKCMH